VDVVVGVDGRRGGWAVAVVRVHAGSGRARHVAWRTVPGQDAAGAAAVLDLAAAAGAAALGVDCPVGLPADGWRPCDLEAKRLLGAASARVFLAPPREVLAAPTYADARAVARDLLGGRSVSAQTYGLRRMVLALDAVLRPRSPALHPLADRVAEVHPELSFMALAGRAWRDPLPSKKTAPGRAAREAALRRWLTPAAAAALADAPDGDDHLDALVTAWSAWRRLSGDAVVLGGEADAAGLPMRIVV
jgi:predicted RNase H-like nuclease